MKKALIAVLLVFTFGCISSAQAQTKKITSGWKYPLISFDLVQPYVSLELYVDGMLYVETADSLGYILNSQAMRLKNARQYTELRDYGVKIIQVDPTTNKVIAWRKVEGEYSLWFDDGTNKNNNK